MKLIAFVAPKESGKTMLADYLVQEHGYTKVNFKDALIDEVKQNFPDLLNYYAEFYECTVYKLFGNKPYPIIIRLLLQNYGTNVRRVDDPDYWIDAWFHKVNELKRAGVEKIVVDDVRFLNEAQHVEYFGGELIRIIRPGYPKNNDQHQSETEQADIMVDFKLINDGTPQDLINKLNDLHIS